MCTSVVGPHCFNSTTVQLILIIDHYYVLDLQCFNSTTVQLIHLIALTQNEKAKRFQFHNGTINTNRCWDRW